MDTTDIIIRIVYGVNKTGKFVLPYLFSVFIFNSCKYAVIPGYVKEQKYNFTNLNTHNKLKGIKGFFKDTAANKPIAIFYDKNICAIGFLGENKDKIEQNLKLIGSSSKHYFYDGSANFYWGTYSIDRDTLKVKIVNHPSFVSPTWLVFEEWYKIINDNTIQFIAYKQIQKSSDSSTNNKTEMIFLNDKRKTEKGFVETSSIPDFNKSWLLKQKWFWADEKEYNEWNKTH